MTPQEQLVLELVNRARLDPVAEARRLGLSSLNEGVPAEDRISTASKQPLAPDADLLEAARGHSRWMIDKDLFGHSGIGDGDPTSRMTAAGYAFGQPPSWGSGENIAWNGSTGPVNATTLAVQNYVNLFVDEGYPGRGHRVNILNEDFREVGNGIANGQYTYLGTTYNAGMLTQNFAYTGTKVSVTGVAINDGDGDNFYDIGEARGNVLVKVGSAFDRTEAAGGYGIKASPGSSYQVTFSGGGLPNAVSATVSNVTQNVKVDLLGTSEILSSTSTTLGAGAKDLGLLGLGSFRGTGNGQANTITGNKGQNTLDGGLGNDVLIGGLGGDLLTDDSGADNFRFNSRFEGGDRITDFVSGSDDLVFRKSAFGNIASINLANFAENLSGLAQTTLDRFVFERDTGILRHDVNGSNAGGSVIIATLTNVNDLAFGDFVFV